MADSLEIDISISDDHWTMALSDADAVCRRAALAAFAATDGPAEAEVSLLLCGDAQIHQLNQQYRDQDKPTNVLSFPAFDPAAPQAPGPAMLGDVVIAFGVADKEADGENKSLADHLAHLVVHGILHLLGYDHEETGEAEQMEQHEAEILAGLGIADPYGDAP